MNKFLAAAAAFLFSTLAAQASTLEQIKNASHELYVNGQAVCSGQFISPTRFLTASHCVKNADGFYSIVVRDTDVKLFQLKIHSVSTQYDTATLDLVDPAAAFSFVDVAEEYTPSAGDPVIVAAFPRVLDYFQFSIGVMTGYVKTPFGLAGDGFPAYMTDLLTAPGSSGGGLYIQRNGEYFLVGTVKGGAETFITFFSVLQGVKAVA